MKAVRNLEVLTFLYHEVVDDPSESGFQTPGALAYKHTTAMFRRDLDLIGKGVWTPSVVFDVDPRKGGRKLLLTFDDGGRSAMRIAGLLAEKGWRGHFFVTTHLMGSKGFLDKASVRSLHEQGHVVGSHSHTHPDVFYSLTRAQMLDEWRTSCRVLEDILGQPVLVASVPGGDMNAQTVATAGEAGIRYLFTSEPRTIPWLRDGVLCFGRVCPKRGTPAERISEFACFRGLRRERIVRWCKGTAKRILGPLYVYRTRLNRSHHGK
jgi:peptidoglycan/xylan/chitin deacetylase (PgdA/CDA1 family)